MAINPNVDFVAGAILTASQQNRFARGIVSYAQDTANSAAFSTPITTLTSTAFTAVANRYYKVTYYEPSISYFSGTVNFVQGTIKNGATVLQIANENVAGQRSSVVATYVGTFAAGSVTITTTMEASGGGAGIGSRSATQPAFVLVEDVGPA